MYYLKNSKSYTSYFLNIIEAANAAINRELALNIKLLNFVSKIKFIYKSKNFKNFKMRFNNLKAII